MAGIVFDNSLNPRLASLESLARRGQTDQGPFLDLTTTADALRFEAASTGVPFWGDQPESWDRVILGGQELPGLAEVDGEISQRLDRKKVPGQNGETVTHLGWEPTAVDITLELWTAEHLRRFVELADIIKPKFQKGPPKPVDIYYPALEAFRIRAVTIVKCSLPKPRSRGADIFVVKMKALEFQYKEKGKVNTPKDPADYGDNRLSQKADQAERAAQVQKPSSDPSNTGP